MPNPRTTRALMARRRAVLGPNSPMFYSEPLELVSGEDVWLVGADGTRYLDAYNNVPHVGHCNRAVAAALACQSLQLNIHTRYLTAPVVEYAETLLATFPAHHDRVFFTNSGSEANDLALRMARQHSGASGVLVSDFSYHGNTSSLAALTTALTVADPRGDHVRTFRVPDLHHERRPGEEVLREALDEAKEAVRSLVEAGHGVSALLFDPLFSTEGLPLLPDGYIEGLIAITREAGGLVIADEVQSGFGRVAERMWGHEMFDIEADIVVLGKPMGNGHPLGAAVTRADILEPFSARNRCFNTFAGNPVSSRVGMAVLAEMARMDLRTRARAVRTRGTALLKDLVADNAHIGAVRGQGTFLGLDLVGDAGAPSAARATWLIEDMRRRGVLISKIGRDDNVLKIRPPLVFDVGHLDILVGRLADSFSALGRVRESTLAGLA